jgi:RecA-family ATPase
VVFVDTLRRAHGGDENSSEHMAKVFGRLQELSIKFDFTSVVIHHMGKEPAEESAAPRTSRGSSVIEDFPDTLGYITKHATGHLEDPRISIRWDFRNHAPIEPSKFVYNRLTGLFERWHKQAKEKHEQQEHVENLSGAGAEDLAAGLLQPV